MAEYIENGSPPIQTFSDAQASILDLLFPGFTRMSTAVQGFLTVDLSLYAPLLCFSGLLVIGCGRICQYLWGLLETYCTSTVHFRYREDAYDILILWISSQSFAENAYSSLVTTDLASSLRRSRNDPSNSGVANKKTLYYTPWNGRFFMRYKGRLLVFRRQYQAGDFSSREEVSISCFGRSQQILRELVSECNTKYTNLVRDKTCLYEHQDDRWTRSAVVNRKRIETVVLNESEKGKLLKDIKDFLDQTSQRWYSNRDIPYRRGYLLYGPPGTGKSSLSKSIAGHFGLDIYILNLSAINEANLTSLFAKLPGRCVILLEDVDAVSLNRDAETEDSRQIVTPSRDRKPASGKVSLSALLNVIDGVGSQEGRVLIMTTNHITRLDEALIRPGRVDKKIELGLADNKMAADLFCLVFKPVAGDVAFTEDAQSGETRKVHEVALSQRKEAEKVERMAKGFAVKVPELKFSPAEIYSFLLEHRKSPGEAIDNVEQLISKPVDTQPQIANDSKLDEESSVTTEMVQRPSALAQPTTPPSTPSLSPSTLGNAEELVNAVMDMQMTSTYAPKCNVSTKCCCSYTPPDSPDLQKPATPVTLQDLKHLVLELMGKYSEDNSKVSGGPRLDSPDDTTSKEVVARASLLAFKEVDEIWDDKAYKYTIVESPKPKSIDNLDQYVFVVRGRVDKKSKEATYFVDVKSFMLGDALGGVLHDVPGIIIMEEKLSIERNILYNFLPEIESCRDQIDPENRASNEHISLLIDYIKTSYADLTQRLGALLKAKEITYDLLWALFKANTLVYTTCQGTKKPRCIKYESAVEETTPSGVEYFHIKGSYLDFDGKILGKVPIETAILKFIGSKPINSLEAFPLHHHVEEEVIKKKLVECGRKFCSLTGTWHRQYDGTAFQMKKGEPLKVTINGRIMVDPVKFQQDNPNYTRPSIFKSTKGVSIWLDMEDVPSTQLDESTLKKGVNVNDFRDEDFLLCSPTVLGYSLGNKLWLEFAVADISDICWDESIFDQLKLPAESKKLIKALTTQHSSREKAYAFDDFVKGKGLGSNILMYGPPGVGKTMTAEALSELLHKPLFTVSAANLSHNSSDLDAELSRIFDVANHWDTLLLLDEADSFLRRRSDNSQHNALVSVFLRKLEYFPGIMLLTTNRVTEFDDAVQSRIHIGIAYSPLGVDTRMSIWESFLKKPNAEGRVVSFGGTELQELAKRKLNGRQVKNAMRAAHALADFEGVDLAMNHLHTVLDIGIIFENDFKGTGATDNENAYF